MKKLLGFFKISIGSLIVALSSFPSTIIGAQNVGIGYSLPKARLHVVQDITGSMGFPYESLVVERTSDSKLGIYSTSANPNNVSQAAVTLGYSNFFNTGGFYPGFEMQYGLWTNSGYILRFNALSRNLNGTYNSNNTNPNILVMNPAGMVGINLTGGAALPPLSPTANLHVNGTVRFQNLPTGGGRYLVVDTDGNVRVSVNTISNRPLDSIVENEAKEIMDLKAEVKILKERLAKMEDRLKVN